MYISDDYEPNLSGQVEIPVIMDVPEDTRTYEDLDNQITQKSQYIQDAGYSED